MRELCAGLPGGDRHGVEFDAARDLDTFVPAGTRLGFAGNRGTAGIDGITSTALKSVTQVDDAVPVVVFPAISPSCTTSAVFSVSSGPGSV